MLAIDKSFDALEVCVVIVGVVLDDNVIFVFVNVIVELPEEIYMLLESAKNGINIVPDAFLILNCKRLLFVCPAIENKPAIPCPTYVLDTPPVTDIKFKYELPFNS